jgi:hypothetical protein
MQSGVRFLGRLGEGAYLFAIVLSVAPNLRAESLEPPRSWLEPCPSLANARSDDLEIQERRVSALKLDVWPFPNSGDPVARLIVEPSFTPDWVVSLYRTKDGSCRVISVLANKNVYYANHHDSHGEFVMRRQPAAIGSTTYQSEIPSEVAARVELAWQNMIAFSQQRRVGDPTVADGTEYTATSFILGIGLTCGRSHTPPEGTPAAQFVEIGVRLMKLARERESERLPIITSIQALANELISRIPQGTGSSLNQLPNQPLNPTVSCVTPPAKCGNRRAARPAG